MIVLPLHQHHPTPPHHHKKIGRTLFIKKFKKLATTLVIKKINFFLNWCIVLLLTVGTMYYLGAHVSLSSAPKKYVKNRPRAPWELRFAFPIRLAQERKYLGLVWQGFFIGFRSRLESFSIKRSKVK